MSDAAVRSSGERLRALLSVPLYLIVFGTALRLPSWIHFPRGHFVPLSVPTHSFMILASIALAAGLSRSWRVRLGFTLGSYRFSPRILLWCLPTAVPEMGDATLY